MKAALTVQQRYRVSTIYMWIEIEGNFDLYCYIQKVLQTFSLFEILKNFQMLTF